MTKWMSPLQRAERMLAARLAELESLVEIAPDQWPAYLDTVNTFLEVRRALNPPVAVTRRDLRQAMPSEAPKNQ